MTIRRPLTGLVLVVALDAVSGTTTASAQAARTPGANGIEAFRSLDFESAVTSLRALLAGPEATQLGDSIQAGLLTYIGAAEYLLGRRADAMRTFRSALEHAPDARPDTLEFPPAITTAFAEARRGTAIVVARPAGPSSFVAGRGRIDFRLEASAPHVLRASIQDERGVVVRSLFDGPISDTLWIAWDGLLSSGAPAAAGRAILCVTSIDSDGIARALKLPLDVERLDVVPRPPAVPALAAASDSAGRSPAVGRANAAGRAARAPRWPQVIAGALGALTVVALPDAMSARPEPSARRFVVGGVLVATSILAFRGPDRGPPSSAPAVRPPAQLVPPAASHEMSRPAATDALARVRISPLATRARSER